MEDRGYKKETVTYISRLHLPQFSAIRYAWTHNIPMLSYTCSVPVQRVRSMCKLPDSKVDSLGTCWKVPSIAEGVRQVENGEKVLHFLEEALMAICLWRLRS
jgi:hypothetical protein